MTWRFVLSLLTEKEEPELLQFLFFKISCVMMSWVLVGDDGSFLILYLLIELFYWHICIIK